MKKDSVTQRHRIRVLTFQLLFALDLGAGQADKILEALGEHQEALAEVRSLALPELEIPEPPEGESIDLAALLAAQKDDGDQLRPLRPQDGEALEQARELALEIWHHRDQLDEILERHVVNWRPERMAAVDRAILRLALWEGPFKARVPIAVAIDEAVELAKRFGSEESGRFVNGALAKIVREQR